MAWSCPHQCSASCVHRNHKMYQYSDSNIACQTYTADYQSQKTMKITTLGLVYSGSHLIGQRQPSRTPFKNTFKSVANVWN